MIKLLCNIANSPDDADPYVERYINPAYIISLEEAPNGTLIRMSDVEAEEQIVYHTHQRPADVLKLIEEKVS